MAATLTKRPWAQALDDAEAFRDLFPTACYERWTIAGSVRRRKPEVSDVEHVVIPAWGEVDTGAGLFGQKERVNLLNFHADALVRGGMIDKHWYGNGNRWGEKYRGCDFRGFDHEIFQTDADNWGAQLLIRTGPAEYSQRVVTAIRDRGMYRQQDGVCVHVASGQPVKVADEETYLRLAGLPFLPPERRQ